jgi:formyltetrahydrofolate synthetase
VGRLRGYHERIHRRIAEIEEERMLLRVTGGPMGEGWSVASAGVAALVECGYVVVCVGVRACKVGPTQAVKSGTAGR